jgi:hypothetical protein
MILKHNLLAAACAAALAAPLSAQAADDKELAEIRAQLREMKQSYEARLQVLEQRLQAAEAAKAAAPAVAVAAPAPALVETAAPAPVAAAAAGGNAFNPSISLILGGTMANLSQDPGQYKLQGFMPSGGEVGPGKRSFNLGESELTLSANIDPMFAGKLTFALSALPVLDRLPQQPACPHLGLCRRAAGLPGFPWRPVQSGWRPGQVAGAD